MSTKKETQTKKEEPKSGKPDVKLPLATFNQRLIAGIIDFGIVFVIIVVASIILSIFNFVTSGTIAHVIGWLLSMILYVAGIALSFYIYVWMPISKDGQSFGKKHQKIKLMMVDDKWATRAVEKGDLGMLLLRWLIGGAEAAWTLILAPWYFITNDPNRQRLADKVAKTIVVEQTSNVGSKSTTDSKKPSTSKTTPKKSTK